MSTLQQHNNNNFFDLQQNIKKILINNNNNINFLMLATKDLYSICDTEERTDVLCISTSFQVAEE